MRTIAEALFAGTLLWGCSSGCGSDAPSPLDEVEFLPVKEELVEADLGWFSVPVPAMDRDHAVEGVSRNWLQVNFQIYAVVRPGDEAAVLAEWERQQGKFRSEVIQLCRKASLDELTEPALTTLKGRIAELAIRRLGRRRVRSLVLNEVSIKLL